MNKNPLVSIIIPNYNSDKFIEETIISVVNQTYSNWELLIIDDHSTDKSIEIIKRYCEKYPNIYMHKTQVNSGGPATPRNIGIDNSKGEFVAFLDSDDTWYPDRLKFHLQFMLRENSNFSATYRNTFESNDQLQSEINESKYLKVYDYQQLLKKNLIDTSSVIIARSLIGDLRFDPAKELIAIEDYDFWLRILIKNEESILVSKTQTMNYRITGENISRSKLKMAVKFLNVISRYEASSLKRFYYFMNYSILSIIYLVKMR